MNVNTRRAQRKPSTTGQRPRSSPATSSRHLEQPGLPGARRVSQSRSYGLRGRPAGGAALGSRRVNGHWGAGLLELQQEGAIEPQAARKLGLVAERNALLEQLAGILGQP